MDEVKRINQFKELEFALEQIKQILTVKTEETLYALIKKKIAVSKGEAIK